MLTRVRRPSNSSAERNSRAITSALRTDAVLSGSRTIPIVNGDGLAGASDLSAVSVLNIMTTSFRADPSDGVGREAGARRSRLCSRAAARRRSWTMVFALRSNIRPGPERILHLRPGSEESCRIPEPPETGAKDPHCLNRQDGNPPPPRLETPAQGRPEDPPTSCARLRP